MHKYKAKTKDGEWVEGWYCEVKGKTYIVPEDAVRIETLAIPVGKGEPVFAGLIEVLPDSVEPVGVCEWVCTNKEWGTYRSGCGVFQGDFDYDASYCKFCGLTMMYPLPPFRLRDWLGRFNWPLVIGIFWCILYWGAVITAAVLVWLEFKK